LEYWREYCTPFHIAQAWGIHEASVCRIVRKVENHLIRSGVFRLPGKRQRIQSEQPWAVVVVDVSETPIERPQKNSDVTIAASERATP
jgi:Helix-turn-helix of DDE superfamily endonuclease